jgi:hypothetical protein
MSADLARFVTTPLDTGADVLLDEYVMLDYLPDDEPPLNGEQTIEALALRALCRQYACPWWRVEGSKAVARVGSQIVEVWDPTKPVPRDRGALNAAVFSEPGRLAELLRSVADHVEHGTNGNLVAADHSVRRQREIVVEPESYSLRDLGRLIGRSKRWLEDRIADTDNPLPCYRPTSGKIMVRKSDYDRWLSGFRRVGNPNIDKIVSDVMSSLRNGR